MITWIILNVIVTIYISIILSSYVRKRIKEESKIIIRLEGKYSFKHAIVFFFNIPSLLSYFAFSFCTTAILMITGYIMEQIGAFKVMPYNMWPTAFFYLFISMLVTAVVINLYISDTKDRATV